MLNRALKNENALIASAFLDAINISSVAVILKVSIELFHSAIFDADTAMIAVTFGLIEIRYRTLFIVIGGAAVGYLFYLGY